MDQLTRFRAGERLLNYQTSRLINRAEKLVEDDSDLNRAARRLTARRGDQVVEAGDSTIRALEEVCRSGRSPMVILLDGPQAVSARVVQGMFSKKVNGREVLEKVVDIVCVFFSSFLCLQTS